MNRPLTPLEIKDAAGIEFDAWLKDMAAMGAKLGEAANR